MGGCLIAGFYLMRMHNVQVSTFAAAALNVVVGLGGLWMAGKSPASPAPIEPAKGTAARDWPVYITIAISGAGALGAEVVWTRLMGMLLGVDGLHLLDHPGGVPGRAWRSAAGWARGLRGRFAIRRGRGWLSAGASCCWWWGSAGRRS